MTWSRLFPLTAGLDRLEMIQCDLEGGRRYGPEWLRDAALRDGRNLGTRAQ